MKVNNLMIGDWVRQQGCTLPTKVAGVTANKIHTIWADGSKHSKDEYYFDPIPLTAEILEKNGFIKGEIERNEFSDVGLRYTYETQDGYFVIIDWQDSFDNGCGRWEERWIIEVFGCNGSFNTNPLERIYVHELQRALRCCGLWNLVENFKIE